MSLNRYARRVDLNQNEIVKGLRQCGIRVDIMGKPVDLLTFYRGRFLPLEIKHTPYKDKRQKEQLEFLAQTSCPVVRTFEEAYAAILANGRLKA